ncbi:Hypothetical protein PHPALM_20144 [Phytophthora palmivora]|uniref:Uncharacterized protein n=1 Tax=Phytophthora palmivora TaxID=4796 RepID=A0A2P4XFL0_9STRA|nr:Hypothetical protein PHPALM_20144 [Phytophthora palmivora]
MVYRARVLASYQADEYWMLVAAHSDIPRQRHVESLMLARTSCVKRTFEIETDLDEYLHENCIYTLNVIKDMVWFGFVLELSTSTIDRKLIGKLYITKQVGVEPMPCYSKVNKAKRMVSAIDLRKRMNASDFIVHSDGINYNSERATVVLTPSKGAKPQVQCAASKKIERAHNRLRRVSIHMDVNAGFDDKTYEKFNSSSIHHEHFRGQRVVVVFDNSPRS